MLLAQILYIVATVSAEWEIPFEIGHYFLNVVGGYPTFIESLYPSTENLTGFDDSALDYLAPVFARSYHSALSWSCHNIPGDGRTCQSRITADNCHSGTQYSVDFYHSTNSSCEKEGRLIQCTNASVEGSTCRNVVIEIRNSSSPHFVQKDLRIPSIITQVFTEASEEFNNSSACYHQGHPIQSEPPLHLPQMDSNGHCQFDSTDFLRFHVNTTLQCLVQRIALTLDYGIDDKEQVVVTGFLPVILTDDFQIIGRGNRLQIMAPVENGGAQFLTKLP
ncbi:unnamed protein product [Nippostrongylus brasiliensis]|uniref:Secreted protein n=1 Tax=Nippostrongylus brasiliensis TaxID=27835 RepID=A0A0N4YIR5_NIPBR|nr:unnamed protein product [Nippostrongylus brasiliensis]